MSTGYIATHFYIDQKCFEVKRMHFKTAENKYFLKDKIVLHVKNLYFIVSTEEIYISLNKQYTHSFPLPTITLYPIFSNICRRDNTMLLSK